MSVVKFKNQTNEFSLELARAVEELSIEKGLPVKEVIKKAQELLHRKRVDINEQLC